MPDVEQTDLTSLTVQLLSAYVSNNTVPSDQLAGLIETTRSALGGKTEPEAVSEPEFAPAVTVRKSLGSKEHILSLIDGKPYKTLKRHLANNGLTPKEYRERYGLPKDYPTVAPSYSERRRAVAHRLGLGRRRASEPAPALAPAVEEVVAPVDTKAPRVAQTKAAPKAAAKSAKPAPAKSAPPAAAPAEATPSVEAAAPKPRGRKPKAAAAPVAAPAATAKPSRKKSGAVVPTADVAPKRTRKPKVAAETA